jgi:serine/threonine-protein kinase
MWLGALIGILVLLLLLGGGYLLAQSLNNNDTPTQVAVARVEGMSYQQAKTTLEQQGFVVARDTQESDQTPNIVLSQDPKPNTLWDVGGTVTLTVAVPFPKVTVPDLHCLSLADAATKLGTDLTLGTKTTTTSDACPADTIVDQNPKAGTEVDPGTIVNVTVTTGPSTIVLQDYTCQTFGKAQAALSKLGLTAVFGGSVASLPQCPNPNFIAQQDPAAGTSVQVGSTVTLYTGTGTTSSSPTPTPTP